MIYKISAEDERKIYRDLPIDYLRLSHEVLRLGKIGQANQIIQLKAVFHYDMRNTVDGCINRSGLTETMLTEKRKWAGGLMLLRVLSVPEWYTQKINRQLHGKLENVEPIFCSGLEFSNPPPSPASPPRRQPEHVRDRRTISGPPLAQNKMAELFSIAEDPQPGAGSSSPFANYSPSLAIPPYRQLPHVRDRQTVPGPPLAQEKTTASDIVAELISVAGNPQPGAGSSSPLTQTSHSKHSTPRSRKRKPDDNDEVDGKVKRRRVTDNTFDRHSRLQKASGV
jgi:hypothetical protein